MTPKYTPRRETTEIVIHCSATRASMDVGVKEIRKWHVEENGWIDIGYHIVIRRNGKVEYGRPLWAVGAHVAGHNHYTVGVCMVGGSDEKGNQQCNFNPEQWTALAAVVAMLKIMPTYNITAIRGHRDYPDVTKYCPSFDVASWLRGQG
jgi:hypothetical protein